jgi:quinol monooxygenase YgiN
MLIVAGTMIVEPEGLAALREIIGPHKLKTEAEAGSVLFSLGVADEKAGEVTVLEIWRDEDALRGHHGQPHTAYFLERVGPYITSMDLTLYDTVNERPLPPLETLAAQ